MDDGGPAFPVPPTLYDERDHVMSVATEGMSMRDYFAAKAMQAWLGTARADSTDALQLLYSTVASMAYAMADAMLKERSK